MALLNIIFCFFKQPYIKERKSVIPIVVGTTIWFLVNLFLCLTVLKDPGYIPPQPEDVHLKQHWSFKNWQVLDGLNG